MTRWRSQEGAYSAEFVALVPLVLLVAIVGWQILTAVSAGSLASNAARNGSRAMSTGDDVSATALRSLPQWLRGGGSGATSPRVDVNGSRVAVTVVVPNLSDAVPWNPMRITRTAELPEARPIGFGVAGVSSEVLPPQPGSFGSRPLRCGGRPGCIEDVTRHLRDQTLRAAGGSWPTGVGCWGERPTNPTSDHPQGLACDFTVGAVGRFPTPAEAQGGWVWAEWFRANAARLNITYVVWHGHIWSASQASRGWRTYDPGAAYDVSSATGGHYDHLHVSVAP